MKKTISYKMLLVLMLSLCLLSISLTTYINEKLDVISILTFLLSFALAAWFLTFLLIKRLKIIKEKVLYKKFLYDIFKEVSIEKVNSLYKILKKKVKAFVIKSDRFISIYRIDLSPKIIDETKDLTIKLMIKCLLTRSFDGYCRMKYIDEIIDTEDFVIPFVIEGTTDYVKEIVELIYLRLLSDLSACDKYTSYCKDNIRLLTKSYSVMISYWNEYYRSYFPKYKDYYGYKVYEECFGYRKRFLKGIEKWQ